MTSRAFLRERLLRTFGGGSGSKEATIDRRRRQTAKLAPAGLHSHASIWLGGAGLVSGTLFLIVAHSGSPSILGALTALGAGGMAACLGAAYRWRKKPPGGPGDRNTDRDDARLFADVHDVLGDITVTRTIDRRIVAVNETFRRLTGCRRPDGLTCEEIGIAFRPGGKPHRYHVEISTADGQRIFVWQDVVTRDSASGQLFLQSVARDVTAERASAQAIEEARRKAEYHSAAKSRLLATVSHEIRTPLSGIIGMTHLLAQTPLTREQESYLTGIRQSGYALTQLVEDLLDFSTIEVGRFNLRPSSESIRTLLESVVEMLAHRAHEKNIEIGASFAFDIPETLSFDAARLRQVLFNVIGNAVKFTQQGGVLVRVSTEGGHILKIEVIDSGPGMTGDEQRRVFGEYEQAGTAVTQRGGTGLGLSISARIIHEFGGSLTVSSEKGRGSTFSIRFPIDGSVGRPAGADRHMLLSGNRVMILAPAGPAGDAIAETIGGLGGTCHSANDGRTARQMLADLSGRLMPPTDLIVDHRLSAEFTEHLAACPDVATTGLRKIFLVNPEERGAYSPDIFDAWLIRPLREQSLIDVLRGRMRGLEKRDMLAESHPGLAVVPSHPDLQEGLDILIGEDDPINAMLVCAVLEKAGHRITHVEDFESLLDAALSGAEGGRPHVIITDLSMPGGDGKDVLARLRAHERRLSLASLPIIVLTADSRDETRRQALLNGANRVIVKPVDPIRLITEVQAVAALSAPRAQVG